MSKVIDEKDFENRCQSLAVILNGHGVPTNFTLVRPDEAMFRLIHNGRIHTITVFYNKVTQTSNWLFGVLPQAQAKMIHDTV